MVFVCSEKYAPSQKNAIIIQMIIQGFILYHIETIYSMMRIKNNKNDSTNSRHERVDIISIILLCDSSNLPFLINSIFIATWLLE